MNLRELFEAEVDTMHDVNADKRGYILKDTRKPKLTLRELNRLRKYRDFKKAQDTERHTTVSVVYAIPDAPTGPDSSGGAF